MMLACDTGPMSIGMWLPILVGVAALIGFGVWAIGKTSRHPATALSILEERLARGEIDAEEFERLRSTLERSR